MSSLITMLEDDLYENGSIEETIDENQNSTSPVPEEETVMENNDNIIEAPPENINVNVTSLSDWINTYNTVEHLVNTKVIDTSNITDLQNNLVLFKNINNDIKDTIILYKNIDEYKVFNLPPDHMTLFGESGFHIQYSLNDRYKIKFYGTKSTVYFTLCLIHDDKFYPIHCDKSNKFKLESHNYTGLSDEQFIASLDNNTNFNFEDCLLMYKPLTKLDEPLNNKREVLNWMHEKSNTIFDVSHAIKINNAMRFILFM